MRVQVVMPQLGESIVEGTIIEWHKKVGDTVKQDEELFTITTDKVDTGVPAPSDGVLVEIVAGVDQTVSVGELVAVLDTEASAQAVVAEVKEAPAAPAPQERQQEAPSEPVEIEAPASQVSPVARKMLEEAGVSDISAISGSGVGGRVLKQDVQAFLDAQDGAATAETEEPKLAHPVASEPQRTPTASAMQQVVAPPILTRAQTSTEVTQPTLARPAEKSSPRVAAQRPEAPKFNLPIAQTTAAAAPAIQAVQVNEGDRVEPMSRTRITVAQNLTYARRTAAHCSTVWEADVTDIVATRKRLQQEYDKLSVHLTYTPFFLAAVANALQHFPVLNAATDGENIIYRGQINVGIASAWKDGLVVPTIRNTNTLSLLGLARAVNDVQRRTEGDGLRPGDLDQATFTVTNTGVFGAKYGVPTLFPPQVGILSVGSIEKRVVVGKDDALRIRSMVSICLTFDHRVADFNDADGFMKHLVEYLETTEW